MTDTLSLDDLFKEAKAAMRSVTKRKEKAKADAPLPDPDTIGLFRNPANWVRTRGIALVHADTQTLLGNFTEYCHRTELDARRLVREADPLPVEATEYVNGDWWMTPEEAPKPKRMWKTSKLLTVPYVNLSHLGVHARGVCVYAVFGEGSLDRVDLATETIFGGGSVLMKLPAGVDIRREILPEAINHILTQLEQPL